MMCSWSWTTVICVLLFSHSCIGGAPTAASTVYIRFGETATLAWNLHGSGNKDFFVRNDFWKETVFHITNFNEFNIANEKLKSRLEFTGNINSSGAGLFSFVLSRADDHDFGQYSCYLGSPQRPGTKIPNCGQQLVVIRVQEPYIEGPEKVSFGSSVDLTCNSFLKSYPNWNLSMNFVWMKNGTSVENGGRHQLASGSRVWRGGRYMNNTLTISGVTRKDRAHRYTCQTVVGDNILTDHSVDYVLSVEYVPESPHNTEVHEGDTVLLSMRTPQHQSRIYLQDPNDINVFEMDSAEVYIWETYWTRIKIVQVITSSDNVTVQFQLSDVTSADAGRYHCSLEKGGHADCDWEHVLVVFNNSVTGSASPSVATSTTDNSVTGSASPSVATSTTDNSVTGSASPSVATSTTDDSVTGSASPSVATSTTGKVYASEWVNTLSQQYANILVKGGGNRKIFRIVVIIILINITYILDDTVTVPVSEVDETSTVEETAETKTETITRDKSHDYSLSMYIS
ncbi:uncharacterized protein LOC124120348 [Haliotis rufescens]|uniref:uncharacterized protein LOC124120348 n=1 Tax=Haliotis rufescens TaxID=6454 RepID=UPI00201F9165|nr:uncharacterized protein LOC124120348 [Haliotis rufescens]